MVYNASKAYVMQLRNADEYPTLCDVVGVTICDFNVWPEQDERGGYEVPMLSRWRMQEQHSGERGLPQVQYAFLKLPKYAAGDAPSTLIDRWAYFFREAKHLTVVPPALSERPFRDALGRGTGRGTGRASPRGSGTRCFACWSGGARARRGRAGADRGVRGPRDARSLVRQRAGGADHRRRARLSSRIRHDEGEVELGRFGSADRVSRPLEC